MLPQVIERLLHLVAVQAPVRHAPIQLIFGHDSDLGYKHDFWLGVGRDSSQKGQEESC